MSTTLGVEGASTSQSYPFVRAQDPEYIPLRPLLDFSPPDPDHLPPMPSPPHSPSNLAGYTVSTHIIPASHLRHTPLVPSPPLPSGSTKAERLASTKNTVQQLKQARVQSWKGKFGSSRRATLWNCINRYVPKKKTEGGVTLLFKNANSLTKEIWEPVLEHLLESEQVEEIWTWESTQHGDTALLNRDQQSAVYDWADNSNDLLNFLVHFLPSRFQRTSLPTHLSRVSESEATARKAYGFGSRTLVAVGHSFSGATLALSALRHPALFSSAILVDPGIVPYEPAPGMYENVTGEGLIWSAIRRRLEWSSRDEALRYFLSSPFYAAWDPSVLRVYVEKATCLHDQDGHVRVRLKMPAIQEAAYIMDNLAGKESFQGLKELDEKVALLWVMPGIREANPISPEAIASALVWRRPANSMNVIIPNVTHMIPQEAPREFASVINNFLVNKYGTRTDHHWRTKL